MQLFNILAIIGLIPVYDRVFVPLLARFGKKMTLLQRIGGYLHCIRLLCARIQAFLPHNQCTLT